MKHAVAVAIAIAAASFVAPARSIADPEEERALDAVAIPSERSPSPKVADWTTAIRVRPTRRSPAASCRVEIVREWMRAKCAGEAFAISMLGGDIDGIAYWIDPATKEGEVLMPLRRGGKHVFQFWKPGRDRTGAFAPEPGLVVQQYWLEGAAAPTVTIF
jgi:hypothetical protein